MGRILATRGPALEASLPAARLGDAVRIHARGACLTGRIDAIRDGRVLLTPHGDPAGIAAGDRVETLPDGAAPPFGTALLGVAVDAAGDPTDGSPRPIRRARRAIPAPARAPVSEPAWTGVRAIDGLLTFGKGARIGIFGAPGTGKSTLLEAIARGALAHAVVVGLIGERGREAERWTRRVDARTTVVCATSDRSAAERSQAAWTAVAQARALQARGLDVLLIIDSLARVAASAREIALALGEPPGRGGYPASVLSGLARLLERAGAGHGGSITLVATVLSDGPQEHDPLSEAVRALVDGHIVLDAALGRAGRFPAIDVPASLSRTMDEVVSEPHRLAAGRLRRALARLRETADLREAGLEMRGIDAELDRAVAAYPALEDFLYAVRPADPAQTLAELLRLADTL